MKLDNIYEHYEIIKESNTFNQSNRVSYSLNISVNDGKFKAKGSGENIRIPSEISSNIVCVEDVINYIIKIEAKNAKTINHSGVDSKDILSQMLFAFMDKESAKYLTTKDEISFSFDYGPSDNNCVGVMITKSIGSPMFSMIMRLNKKALPNQFNKDALDARILSYTSLGNTKNV